MVGYSGLCGGIPILLLLSKECPLRKSLVPSHRTLTDQSRFLLEHRKFSLLALRNVDSTGFLLLHYVVHIFGELIVINFIVLFDICESSHRPH